MPDNRRPGPLDNLYDIVGDLWGNLQTDQKKAAGAQAASGAKPASASSQSQKKSPSAADAGKAAQPLPFEEFWKMADESVDWTDALFYALPPDDLTPIAQWRYYHEMAPRVLAGDTEAYMEVLRRVKPLADLKPYAETFHVRVTDEDHLTVTLSPRSELSGDTPEARRRCLAGLALRSARDLSALLPVSSLDIAAGREEDLMLNVTIQRDQLRNVKFGYADPVAFMLACGGQFSGPADKD